MNILMVHPHEVYSPLEPWTTRIINFAREFAGDKHNVQIVYFPLAWKDNSAFERDGIRFIPFCRKAGICNIIRNCKLLSRLADWADIVHLQKCFHYASLPALVASALKNKPLHYDWDDWEEMIYYESACSPHQAIGWFLRSFEKNIPAIAGSISVSSKHLSDLCISMGIAKNRIFYVPVGADLEKFHPDINPKRIRELYHISHPLVLYVGQLHGGQYADLFIKAAKIILDNGIDADFMIVGDGARAPELKELARKFNYSDKIIFTGAVDNDAVPEYIAAGDIAVACFEDNLVTRCKSPLKIAEYLASGKPIVASNVGEVGRMISDAGILVEPGRPEALAEKITLLISRHDLRKELALKARRRAEDIYNWRISSGMLLEAYESILKRA